MDSSGNSNFPTSATTQIVTGCPDEIFETDHAQEHVVEGIRVPYPDPVVKIIVSGTAAVSA